MVYNSGFTLLVMILGRGFWFIWNTYKIMEVFYNAKDYYFMIGCGFCLGTMGFFNAYIVIY